MTSVESKTFSFFVNSSPEEISKKEEPYLQYILLQNDWLHQQVEEFKKEIKNIKEEKEEFERDNENCEKKIISLRGIAYNEHEMHELLTKISYSYIQLIGKHKNVEKDYDLILFMIVLFNIILTMIKIITDIHFVIFFVIMLSIIIFGTTCYISLRKKTQSLELEKKYSEMIKEYKSLMKNQDYISKTIDNI